MKRFWSTLLLALALPLALAAQTPANNAFTGTWKLNVAKSKFDPGPGPKSVTLHLSEVKASVDEIQTDGKKLNYSFTPSQGVAVPIEGMRDATIMEQRIDDHTVEHTWKFGPQTLHGKAVLSSNGKHMTYTMTGTTLDGKSIHNIEMYDKQ